MHTPDVLESLLAKLNSGDAAAIEKTLVAHQDYLRMIVRRQLSAAMQAKFDSIDVVHSVWLRLLPKLRAKCFHFATAKELQAFLVRVTRNHLINKVQHFALESRYKLRRVGSAEGYVSREPPPDQTVAAEELWQQLLASCSPVHRQVLELKRGGTPLDQISSQTGLHASSVRRILYELMGRIAEKRKKRSPAART